jgi:Secretion system C-terminal sorting domain
MKLSFTLFLFLTVIFKGFSQESRAFAITGQANANFNWTDIRVLDMATGNTSSTLFENGKTKFSFTDAETRKAVDKFILQSSPSAVQQTGTGVTPAVAFSNPSPTMLMSAAAAYDKRHDKLFFASMRTGQLIWLDLRSNLAAPSFYTIQKTLVNNADYNDEALNITRMTIGADGNGYALTNDGNHLVRFTTGSKTIISDLGNLIDAASNNGISVHNRCSSWGGDMVADAFGSLYLFTASRNVFVIEPETRIATYKGTLLNLSPSYTVNGAAVINDNSVIVSSANTFEGFYSVNVKDLSATKLVTKGQVYNASDLASCNLLHQAEKQNSVGAPALTTSEVIGNRLISIFPNPVSNGQVRITFDGNASGKYKVALTDLQGRFIDSKDVYIKGAGQVETFQLRNKQATGVYMIKITDAANKAIFSDKLIIE